MATVGSKMNLSKVGILRLYMQVGLAQWFRRV